MAMLRGETTSSNQEEKENEMNHIKEALAANEYQPWIMKMPREENSRVDQH